MTPLGVVADMTVESAKPGTSTYPLRVQDLSLEAYVRKPVLVESAGVAQKPDQGSAGKETTAFERDPARQAKARNSESPVFTQDLQFELHAGSGRMMVKVVDLRTGEVLRVVPPEEVLNTFARIRLLIGLWLDRRV